MTTYGISDNGVENVDTEAGSVSLTTAFSNRLVSHLRAQYSRDLEWSNTNSTDPLNQDNQYPEWHWTLDQFCRAKPGNTGCTLPRLSAWMGRRNSWKFGGDALLTWIYDFFPSDFGGEYIFDPIKVNPFTFAPHGRRASAHFPPRLCPSGAALLCAGFRISGYASRHQ